MSRNIAAEGVHGRAAAVESLIRTDLKNQWEKPMIIDVHAHCYPACYCREIQKHGMGKDGGIGVKIPEWVSDEERIAFMDELGVDMQVLGLSAPSVNCNDPVLSKDLARMTNEFIAQVCKKHPERFIGLASVPLNRVGDTMEELNYALDELGMDGVTVGTNIDKQSLAEEQFRPFLEELNLRKIPLVLHPLKAIGDEFFTAEDIGLGIPSNVGFIFETTRTVAQLVFKGVFEELKNLIVVLPHSGGAIPFLYPRWDMFYRSRADSHPLKKLPHPPSHYLKKLYYDTALSYHPSSLTCTAALAGSDHMLFGTDCPYTSDFRSKESIVGIDQSGFSPANIEKIYYKNAKRIFTRLPK